jgi:hypothetical protein
VKGREILGRAAEAVTFLFAMFSGFLENVAPPEDVADFAVGLASFLALILLLFLSVQARGHFSARRRVLWMRVAGGLAVVALIAGLVYQRNLGTLTFYYPPEDADAEHLIGGTRYLPAAQTLADQGMSPGQVLAQFGPDNLNQVWAPGAIENARTVLTVNYLVLVLALAGTIFGLVEIYLAGEEAAARKASARPRPSSEESPPAGP